MKGRSVAMKTKLERCGALGMFVLLAVSGSGSVLAGETKAIPRSLYVPVSFRSCEHLVGTTLFIGDQPVGSLPTERIFVFTYYPNLKRLEPAFTELSIEGVRSDDGSPFLGRLAINPTAISTAEERIDLDFERAKQQFTYRIDVRYEKVHVLIRCEAACGHEDDARATASLGAAPTMEVAEKP